MTIELLVGHWKQGRWNVPKSNGCVTAAAIHDELPPKKNGYLTLSFGGLWLLLEFCWSRDLVVFEADIVIRVAAQIGACY